LQHVHPQDPFCVSSRAQSSVTSSKGYSPSPDRGALELYFVRLCSTCSTFGTLVPWARGRLAAPAAGAPAAHPRPAHRPALDAVLPGLLLPLRGCARGAPLSTEAPHGSRLPVRPCGDYALRHVPVAVFKSVTELWMSAWSWARVAAAHPRHPARRRRRAQPRGEPRDRRGPAAERNGARERVHNALAPARLCRMVRRPGFTLARVVKLYGWDFLSACSLSLAAGSGCLQ